jgi:2-methylcitrate dehydratase PrpD
VPALLAEAETRNLELEQMLRAIVLGYEIITRVARSWMPKALVMQSHGHYAAVGAAAGIALSRGCDAATLAAAISTAVTLIGPSPRTHLAEGVLSRNVCPPPVPGRASWRWNGLNVAFAAHRSLSTIPLRRFSAVEATLELRPGLLARCSLDEIDSIRVETYPMAMVLMNPRPDTTLGAKLSMSHAVAAALATGRGGAEAFAAGTLADPVIDGLRGKVSVAARERELPPPLDRPARVVVEIIDGSEIDAECLSAVGGPNRPLPPEVVSAPRDDMDRNPCRAAELADRARVALPVL